MSFAQTVALGALAGLTIFLGLPVGRMQLLSSRARVALAMFAVGVLAFIFVDVLANGLSIVDGALTSFKHHRESFAYVVWLVVLLTAGFGAGSAGLAMIQRRLRPLGARRPSIAGGANVAAVAGVDPNTASVELEAARRRALRTGLTIAAAIGVHGEGHPDRRGGHELIPREVAGLSTTRAVGLGPSLLEGLARAGTAETNPEGSVSGRGGAFGRRLHPASGHAGEVLVAR